MRYDQFTDEELVTALGFLYFDMRVWGSWLNCKNVKAATSILNELVKREACGEDWTAASERKILREYKSLRRVYKDDGRYLRNNSRIYGRIAVDGVTERMYRLLIMKFAVDHWDFAYMLLNRKRLGTRIDTTFLEDIFKEFDPEKWKEFGRDFDD